MPLTTQALTVRTASPAWADYSTTMRSPGLRLNKSLALLPRNPAIDLLAATTILDIDGHVPPEELLNLIFAFPALEVLRLRTSTLPGGAPVLTLAARTVILFVCSLDDPAPFPADDHPMLDIAPDVGRVRPTIREGTTKLVVNMEGDDGPDVNLIMTAKFGPPKSLRELVLLMPAYPAGRAREAKRIFKDPFKANNTVLLLLAYYNKCTVTVVGADDVGPGYIAKLCERVAGALGEATFETGDSPTIEEAIQFVSRTEYFSRVGKRVAELETVERL
jgi:hypothetical protein